MHWLIRLEYTFDGMDDDKVYIDEADFAGFSLMAPDILPHMELLTTWQLAHMSQEGNPISQPLSSKTWNSWSWVQESFFVGLKELTDISKNETFDQGL